jgi:hypothetical protein
MHLLPLLLLQLLLPANAVRLYQPLPQTLCCRPEALDLLECHLLLLLTPMVLVLLLHLLELAHLPVLLLAVVCRHAQLLHLLQQQQQHPLQ